MVKKKKIKNKISRNNSPVKFNSENIAKLEEVEEGLNILDEISLERKLSVSIVNEEQMKEVEMYTIDCVDIGLDMAQFIARRIDNKKYRDNYKEISILTYCKEFGSIYFNLNKGVELISKIRDEDKNCSITISKFNILSQIHTEIETQIRNTREVNTKTFWLEESSNLVIAIEINPFPYMQKVGFYRSETMERIIQI